MAKTYTHWWTWQQGFKQLQAIAAAPMGWRVDYGAIGLPADDPARITGVLFYETEAEAAVACDEMDFNSIITPLYAKAGGPNV